MDSPTKNSEEILNQELLTQAETLLKQSLDMDKTFRGLLKTNWKDKKLVGEISDSIHVNNQTIESLKNEIKDRNSRIVKK